MKQEIILRDAEASRDFDLGTWLGRRQAFSMVAGKASAADVECLRTIRDQRLYKSKKDNWPDFCTEYVGASKTQVDRLIRYLEEFGPLFFELTHVTRITPETYRLIAGNVSTEGLSFDNAVIPITQENSARISAAVAELRKKVEPPRVPSRRVGLSNRQCNSVDFAMLQMRFEELIECLDELSTLDAEDRAIVAGMISKVRASAASLGVR